MLLLEKTRPERWGDHIPKDCAHARVVSAFLDNQKRYLDELDEKTRSILKKHVGDSYEEVILRAAARAIAHDMIPHLFGVQPQPGVAGKVAYLEAEYSDAEATETGAQVPEVRLRQAVTPTQAKVEWCLSEVNDSVDMRKLNLPPELSRGLEAKRRPVRIAASSPIDRFAMGFASTLVQGVFSQCLQQIRKAMIDAVVLKAQTVVADGGTLERAAKLLQAVYKANRRGPANRLYGVKKHWHACTAIEDRATYLFDPRFIAYQILGLYKGLREDDAALIWAPVCFVFKPAQDVVTVEGQPTRRDVADVGICHSFVHVRPDYAALVNV